MHRGTAFIITNNDKNKFEVHKSTEFNGGMGIGNFGRDMYEILKNLKNKKDFDKMIRIFDGKYFKYNDDVMTYLADSQEEPYIDNQGQPYFEYSLINNQFKIFYDDNGDYIYTSDSNYIKNMSDRTIQIVCSNGIYELEPNQIMVTDYSRCINNIGKTFGEKIDENINIEKLKIGEYIETSKENKLINDFINFFEDSGFKTSVLKENGMKCGIELESWTACGVDMIEYIEFDDDYQDIYNINSIMKQLKEIYDNFEVDEQIDTYRQMRDYKKVFSIKQSLEDFEKYEKKLEDLMINFADKFKSANYQKNIENELEKE